METILKETGRLVFLSVDGRTIVRSRRSSCKNGKPRGDIEPATLIAMSRWPNGDRLVGSDFTEIAHFLKPNMPRTRVLSAHGGR